MPPGVAEQSGRCEYEDRGFALTGRADLVTDGEVWDYKTQAKALDIERYYDAYQWRAYLLLFGRGRFVYNWFRLKPAHRGATHDYQVIDQVRFDQYAYEGMEDDVLSVASDLAEFRRSRGLEHLNRR